MGSCTHIVDDREVLNYYEYDAWRNIVNQKETIKNRFKFNGQQLDPITQQYYLRARFYNPVIARFIQEDTYRGDGLNLYAYCKNNPVYYVDPTGNACNKAKEVLSNAIDKKFEPDINWTNHGYKHFPDKNKSWKETVKSTKNGPAKYSLDIKDIKEFEIEAWLTGTPTNNNKNWKVKFYDQFIGATSGKETKYIRVENSANTIHGHPISESEYLKLLK